jgi:hypothetical protein
MVLVEVECWVNQLQYEDDFIGRELRDIRKDRIKKKTASYEDEARVRRE